MGARSIPRCERCRPLSEGGAQLRAGPRGHAAPWTSFWIFFTRAQLKTSAGSRHIAQKAHTIFNRRATDAERRRVHGAFRALGVAPAT